MVKGLIKNGLIAENWSSNGVGVRYRLTKKGKSHLRKLEEAARCGSNLANKAFVRLRMKI
jgi:predicted transcriptional regulator